MTGNTLAPDAAVARAIELIIAKAPDLRATIRREFPKLTPADIDAALDLARAIKLDALRPTVHGERGHGGASFNTADPPATLARLARAVGYPGYVPVLPWLQERGFVEKVGGGFRFRTTKRGAT
jgi:hypothetical protein